MGSETLLGRISDSIVNLNENEVEKLIRKGIKNNVSIEKMLSAISGGADKVGLKYEGGEYFLAELVMAGETLKRALSALKPHLRDKGTQVVGRIVIGTVKGDVHDIGKNILIPLLISAGFEVYDLGVDVSANDFINKLRETNADVLGLSVLLTVNIPYIKTIVEELKRSGLREKVKVIIGGGCTRQYMVKELSVDAWASSAVEGVRVCRELMRNR